MKKSKLFSLIALVLAMLMVFAACAPAANNEADPTEGKSDAQVQTPADKEDEPAAEPVTITYCNFNSSGGNEETLAKMVVAFETEHPNIKVEVETIGYDDYFTQMQTRVAGGTAPDCYELNIENFAAYANKGQLAEISGVDVSGLNDTALNAFNVNGKQYGLPESFSNVVLIYNKDLFDQAGVAYPTDDWTQADLQVAAEKIRALGDDIYGIWQPITYNEFFKVVAQYGGALLNEDKTKFTINSAENLAAATALVDRVLVSNVQPNAVQQGGMGDWDMFMSGRLGMIPTGAADPNALRRCALGIIRIALEFDLHFDIRQLFARAHELYGDRQWKLAPQEALDKLLDFFAGRVRNYWQNRGEDSLLVDAALGAGVADVCQCGARLAALAQFSKEAGYAEAVQMLTENRSLLDGIAAYLLSKETITGEELMAFVNPPKAEETAEEAADAEISETEE